MLGSVRSLRLSKTARSCPGHDKARGSLNSILASSVFGRRHADDIVKGPTESAKAREAGVEADVGHTSVGLAQHEHGALDTPALQVAMRCLAKRRLEGPDEMSLGHARHLGEVGDVERVGIRAVDRIARAQHPAIQLLHGPTHRFLTVAASEQLAGK